ncbi:hypothetical protein [Parabacteroides sp. PF5-6]|uniref:hypothetical protein n=1 Tax=Parabacteroides sp. PF5-6 TaxID=1742403 RepID=UPI00240729DB|nr:hypothetical protein [Parabacteroides sp. PF5-6]MDF9829617.1 hypothetical protein [Parabacteroides sp. PF5-6]
MSTIISTFKTLGKSDNSVSFVGQAKVSSKAGSLFEIPAGLLENSGSLLENSGSLLENSGGLFNGGGRFCSLMESVNKCKRQTVVNRSPKQFFIFLLTSYRDFSGLHPVMVLIYNDVKNPV